MNLKLKVKSGTHRPKGSKKNYTPGDVFDGTRGELLAFGDKLELAPPEIPTVAKRGRPRKVAE